MRSALRSPNNIGVTNEKEPKIDNRHIDNIFSLSFANRDEA